jgi:hypothetical protein
MEKLINKLIELVSPPESNDWKDSIPYWITLATFIATPVIVIAGLEDTGLNKLRGGLFTFVLLGILWIVIAFLVSNFFQKLFHNKWKSNDTTEFDDVPTDEIISADEPITTEVANAMTDEIKAILHDFLDKLCPKGDMVWFTNQVVSMFNEDEYEAPVVIKLTFLKDTKEQEIKDEVSYYTYKIYLILKRKKIKQVEVSSYFYKTFFESFPKTSESTFNAKLSENYEKHKKKLRRLSR